MVVEDVGGGAEARLVEDEGSGRGTGEGWVLLGEALERESSAGVTSEPGPSGRLAEAGRSLGQPQARSGAPRGEPPESQLAQA